MILLIDDRSTRQKEALTKAGIDIDSYREILTNAINEKYNETYESLKNGSFDFENYNFIIAHKSAFGDDNSAVINQLEKRCAASNISLLLFSGGIDNNYHDSEKNYAEVSSTSLYSAKLQDFLEEAKRGNININILIYGKEWKTNILLNLLEKTNLYIENNDKDKIFYKRFVSDIGIDVLRGLEIEIYQPELDGKFTSVEEVKKIAESIRTLVTKQ